MAHWVVVGFGPFGQTLALQAARLAHFENRLRLRLTLADDLTGAAARRKAAFVDRAPGFGPDPDAFTLDAHLDGPARVRGGHWDSWAAARWRPSHEAWQTRAEAGASADAVEYAVHAEYLDVPTAVDAPAVVDALVRRFAHADPPVRPAVVVCFEDEERTFQAALALRAALAGAVTDGRPEGSVPVYAHLPTEPGLAAVFARHTAAQAAPAVPVYPFGVFPPGELLRWVARPDVAEMARGLHETYRALYGGDAYDDVTPALQLSNEDAVAHLDVKLDAIGAMRRPLESGETPPPMPEVSGDASAIRLADGTEVTPDELAGSARWSTTGGWGSG